MTARIYLQELKHRQTNLIFKYLLTMYKIVKTQRDSDDVFFIKQQNTVGVATLRN